VTREELLGRLNDIATQLAPVAGTLMMVACSNGKAPWQPEEHDEGCDCQICRAFLATLDAQNKLEAIIKELSP